MSRVVVLLLTAIGVAACGSAPTNPPAVSVAATAPAAPSTSTSLVPSGSRGPSAVALGLDVCGLLPPGLLSSILGGEMTFANPVHAGGWAVGQCAWNGKASSFLIRVGTAASITAFGDPAAPDAKAMLAAFKQHATASGIPTDAAAGIGDGAVLNAGGMAAYLGGTYVEVTRLRLTDDQIVEIMRLAVGNL